MLRHGITAVTDATPDLDDQAITAIGDAMAPSMYAFWLAP
jgi:hypothetical protein